jgi:hypothetical protein
MGRAVTAFKMQTGNYVPPASSPPKQTVTYEFTPVSKAQAFPPGWSVTNSNYNGGSNKQAGIQSLVNAAKDNPIQYSGRSTIPGGTTTVIKTNTGTTGINAPLNSGNGIQQNNINMPQQFYGSTVTPNNYGASKVVRTTTSNPGKDSRGFTRNGNPLDGFLGRN